MFYKISFWGKAKNNSFYWLSNFKCHLNVTFKVDENTFPNEMSDSNDINPFENIKECLHLEFNNKDGEKKCLNLFCDDAYWHMER